MSTVNFDGVEVNRCDNCNGIWFDAGEHEALKKMKGSESLDIGDALKGKKNNEIGNIDCPRCNVKMIKMVDVDQHHIWYEACSMCYGVYFDAGEFKDYKEEGFLDKVKDFFTPERT